MMAVRLPLVVDGAAGVRARHADEDAVDDGAANALLAVLIVHVQAEAARHVADVLAASETSVQLLQESEAENLLGLAQSILEIDSEALGRDDEGKLDLLAVVEEA